MSTTSSSEHPAPTTPAALAAVAQRLRATGIGADLEPVRDAFPGTQTATAALWLATRLSAATESYADRVAALASRAEEAEQQTEQAPAQPARAEAVRA